MGGFKRCTSLAEFQAIEAKFYADHYAERLHYTTLADGTIPTAKFTLPTSRQSSND